ncbi:hypothetical protein BASA83_004726 [Batrachochytrium salamandrivorans]|nr:hypothetical protein BASA83_004726 [Batrachochytrium salamandrivorans]
MIGLEEDPSDYIDTSTGSDGAIKADVHRTKDNKGSALGQTKGADPKSLFKSPKSKGKTTNPPMQQRIKPKRGTYLTRSGRNRRPRAGLDGLYHKYGFKKGSKRQNKLYRSGRKAPRTYAQYLREREARLQADLNKSGQETTDTPRKFVPVKRPWYDFIWTKPKRKTGTPFKQFVHEWKAQHQASLDRSRQRTTGTSRKYNPEDEAQHPLEKEAQRRASLDKSGQKTTRTSRKYNPEDEAQHPLEKEAQRRASLDRSGKKTIRTSRKFVPAKSHGTNWDSPVLKRRSRSHLDSQKPEKRMVYVIYYLGDSDGLFVNMKISICTH